MDIQSKQHAERGGRPLHWALKEAYVRVSRVNLISTVPVIYSLPVFKRLGTKIFNKTPTAAGFVLGQTPPQLQAGARQQAGGLPTLPMLFVPQAKGEAARTRVGGLAPTAPGRCCSTLLGASSGPAGRGIDRGLLRPSPHLNAHPPCTPPAGLEHPACLNPKISDLVTSCKVPAKRQCHWACPP